MDTCFKETRRFPLTTMALCLLICYYAFGEESTIRFSDLTESSGLFFQHHTDSRGRLMLPEITGSGGAAFDYDQDGDMDLYLVQGAVLDMRMADPSPSVFRDRLFRNDLKGGEVRWTDVTEASCIPAGGYGMGVASGDYNKDGWIDLYVTNLGRNFLLKNLGNGRFEEVALVAGVADPGWGTSAVFVDFDRDGWLDLFVVNYLVFSAEWDRRCYARNSALDFCGPSAYEPAPDRLFRNLGNGSFENVTSQMGFDAAHGPGLGVVAGDWDHNGFPDIYVANDGARNQLWLSQGTDRPFKDVALLYGAAVNGMGAPEAGMGVDSADFDNDGDEDLFLAHLMTESNTLYVNNGKALFDDRTIALNLHASSLNHTGFGAGWADFDSDGWLDLLVANGGVKTMGKPVTSRLNPMAQPNLVFRNLNGNRFDPISQAFPGELPQSSRGAIFGDYDNDGDVDVVISNNGGTAEYWSNVSNHSHHWIGFQLRDPSLRSTSLARVKLTSLSPDASPLTRWARVDGSYCSARDPRVLVGLGLFNADCRVEVTWPDGAAEVWEPLSPDRYWILERRSRID